MVLGFRALAALAEDEGLTPSTHTFPHNHPEDPTPSFDLCRHCIHVNMHICKQNTPITKSNKSEKCRR